MSNLNLLGCHSWYKIQVSQCIMMDRLLLLTVFDDMLYKAKELKNEMKWN